VDVVITEVFVEMYNLVGNEEHNSNRGKDACGNFKDHTVLHKKRFFGFRIVDVH
jgi:hypothetical protein